jgi:N-acetylmuramoyl-L-alanine amidase
MLMKIAYLDAGHAHCTAGKRSPDSTLMEWEFNKDVVELIKTGLTRCGITSLEVNPTPEKGTEVSLGERCSRANKHWADNKKPEAVYVSVHANALSSVWSSAKGTETYVYNLSSVESTKCAKTVHLEILRALGTVNRGVKEANFAVLRNTNMPAILLEYGFYSNKEECEMLKSKAKRKVMAEATVKGLCLYFGVEYKAEVIVKPAPVKPIVEAVKPAVVPQVTKSIAVKKTIDTLNVRTGPGISFPVIKTLAKYAWVVCYETKGAWDRIECDGKVAWVGNSYLEQIKKETTANLKLRETPETGNVILTMPKGAVVDVIESGEWNKIKYQGKIGYCSNEYLKVK